MLKTFMRESIDLVPAGTSRNANGRPVVGWHGSTLRSPVDKDQGYH
jgi:hypothetical protein